MKSSVVALVVGLCVGCAQHPTRSDESNAVTSHAEEASLRQWFDDWKASTDGGDQDRAHALLADDAIFLVPGFGRMDPKVFVAGASNSPEKLKLYEFSGGSEIEEIRVSGSLAYIMTKSEFAITVKATGQHTKYSGHSLTVLEKDSNGEWKLIRDANTVLPVTNQ